MELLNLNLNLNLNFYATAASSMIFDYTGLTPTAFLAILFLMVLTYRFVCGMFFVDISDDPESIRKRSSGYGYGDREPVQLGMMTEAELRGYDGSNRSKPLLMAIKGNVYDVSSGRMFYGPGGPYSMFTGRDASRALALLSFKPQDLNGNLEGLDEAELEVLQDWEFKFMEKYPKVGVIVKEKTSPNRNLLPEITKKVS